MYVLTIAARVFCAGVILAVLGLTVLVVLEHRRTRAERRAARKPVVGVVPQQRTR